MHRLKASLAGLGATALVFIAMSHLSAHASASGVPGQSASGVYAGQLLAGWEAHPVAFWSVVVADALLLAVVLFLGESLRRRSKTLTEVRSLEQTYWELFDKAGAGFCVIEIESRKIIEVNQAVCDMTGYTRKAILSMVPSDFSLGDEAEGRLHVAQAIASHSHRWEWPMKCRDGNALWTEITLKYVEIGGRRMLLGTLLDLNERKQAEGNRVALENQLFQAQKMEAIGQLAGGVAHDMNNMLTAIMGYVGMIPEELPPAHPALKHSMSLVKIVDKSRGILKQLLTYARQEGEDAKPMRVIPALVDSCTTIGPLLGDHIELVVRPGNAVWGIHFDGSRLHQVLMNLIVNARDAMPQGGEILVEAKNCTVGEGQRSVREIECPPGNYVEILVTDAGTGISAENMDRIFDPFFSTKAIGYGTGLGLSVVFGIVRQANGYLGVQSQKGQGTTFRILIPALDESAMVELDHRPEAMASPMGSGTVLLVEDCDTLREILGSMVEGLGYEVLEADGPAAALAFLAERASSIDLLLTDYMMPGMNGGQLAKMALEMNPMLKTLVMTGYAPDLDDGTNVIFKPFSREQLGERLMATRAGSVSPCFEA